MVTYLTEHFKRQLRSLKKKYPRVMGEFIRECEEFKEEGGVSIGRSIYKIRIRSKDQKKGKSGGFRSYIYLFRKNDLLVPICIYAKSSQESLTESELQFHIDIMNEELLKLHLL